MKPIIGIIMRKSFSESNKKIEIIYDDIILAVINSGGIPIGITNNNINLYIDIIDGLILQGGDDIDNDNLNIIKIVKAKDIPLLGICLGMQEMAYYDKGILYDIVNHNGDIFHMININKNSLLYKILKKEKINVNSRHKSAVMNTKLDISSYSDDFIIESIEDNSKKFYLGVQWHPESIYNDINMKKIFDYFINICHD